MFTLCVMPCFKGTKIEMYKALTICLLLDGILIYSHI